MRIPELDARGIDYRLVGISALETFFGMAAGPIVTIETHSEIVELASAFETLHFPGMPGWDALVCIDGREILLRTVDTTEAPYNRENGVDHPLLRFSWNPVRRAFADPDGLYPLLKEARSRRDKRGTAPQRIDVDPVRIDGLDTAEAALITARFPIAPAESSSERPRWHSDPGLPVIWHRLLLTSIMTGRFTWRALEILYREGYIDDILPELVPMNRTEHSKEGHPEGNVWRHSLETFRYRKTTDLLIGLGLLLHDCGKPYAVSDGPRRFNRHADIGADVATRMLRRLEFDGEITEGVRWLVRYHMIPGELERLPDSMTGPIMDSNLFPLLLELYRCDLSSTYRGPDAYYRACTVYRRYLKRERRNARFAPMGKMVKLYVE
ncbi:MAG: HD domain-containing protein [Spirochaetales bacterium]|nr:HD domain-containing protein [Spirochaetales bacterium]